jgi:hypothetical protein
MTVSELFLIYSDELEITIVMNEQVRKWKKDAVTYYKGLVNCPSRMMGK